ncbi:MAG TPA: isoprenylcysteine carboxylmethyltransferase family protein [Bryobacteraceae bacterium]|jgi:protein-S-isoprenylcysteine O-methyltransferase Ste14
MLFAWTALVVCWFAWGYPFIFRAPHNQKRASITVPGPTRVGLLLESLAIFMAFAIRLPADSPPSLFRVVPAVLLGISAAVMGWTSVAHLGKQFRVQAGLYADHELVKTGPYSIVRHPIYASLFAMLICTLLILTPWEWFLVPLALFIAGTEIRVRSEDALLESRFGEKFREYQNQVRAYVPFVR